MSGSNSLRPGDEATKVSPVSTDEPLGLTVHSLPPVQEAVSVQGRQVAHGRWKMFAVLLVCAAPVVASYFTYYVLRPEGRRSHGDLIDPQRPLPAVAGVGLKGEAIPLPSLHGQWLLVSVAGGACNALCEKHLYLQRQLREGLGKNKDRLDWVWLVPDDAPLSPMVRAAIQQATVVRLDAGKLSQWLEAAKGQQLQDHLYLVDPMGNWMMRFPPIDPKLPVDAEAAAKIKRDLERVLRASAFWDEAGRPAKP